MRKCEGHKFDYTFEFEEMNIFGINVCASGEAEFYLDDEEIYHVDVVQLDRLTILDEDVDVKYFLEPYNKVLESIAAKLDEDKMINQMEKRYAPFE